MTEIVKQENNELVSQEDLEFLIRFDEQKKRAQVIEDKIKKTAHSFLEENGLLETGYTKELDGATLHIFETKPYIKKQVDTNALKENGLYDFFVKDVVVSGSTRIKVEYEEG